MTSDVAAAKLEMASPDKISVTRFPSRATMTRISTAENAAPAIAATAERRKMRRRSGIKHDDGAESGGLRRAEDRRLAKRVAQQSLRRCAAKPELRRWRTRAKAAAT